MIRAGQIHDEVVEASAIIEQIPDEVVEAVMYCFHTRSSARAAIAAALSTWPKGEFLGDDFCQPRFVLPFPSKEGDA